jgi:hypothetical protein
MDVNIRQHAEKIAQEFGLDVDELLAKRSDICMDNGMSSTYLRLMALRMSRQKQTDRQETVDRLMRRFASMADHMREHGYGDESSMSPAELIVKRALDASDNGANVEVFWPTLRQELRAWLDANSPTRATASAVGSATDLISVRYRSRSQSRRPPSQRSGS